MLTLKLPRKHAQDWFQRCAGEQDRLIDVTARTVTLYLTAESLNDLVSDAEHYASTMFGEWTDGVDYRPAARTCLRALGKAALLNTSPVHKALTPRNLRALIDANGLPLVCK